MSPKASQLLEVGMLGCHAAKSGDNVMLLLFKCTGVLHCFCCGQHASAVCHRGSGCQFRSQCVDAQCRHHCHPEPTK
jgi:hypothetical protein